MAPLKNKKKFGTTSKSTSKYDVSGKKPLKRCEKTGSAAKSHSEEVAPDNKVTEEKKDDVEESVPTTKVKKPCTWLKLDRLNPPVANKPPAESSKQDKEANLISPSQTSNDNKRKRNEKGEDKRHRDQVQEKQTESHLVKKEKEMTNDGHEDTRRDEEDNIFGGLIFMCNAKTKPDCFRYQLMGVPASKKEVVMNIEPGLKIFLYDYDLKLMYGVFEASSPGGMKLEPAAFSGAFPAQVRYTVYKDSLPLPESVFKKAIKDSYNENTRKFKTELTLKQVKKLINLFTPAPWLRPHGNSVVQEPTSHVNSYTHGKTLPDAGQYFLTEDEYRNNGLRQGRHLLPTTAGDLVGHSREPNRLDVELKQLLRNPSSTSAAADPLFFSEKEYRTYGLRGPNQVLNGDPPMMTTNAAVRETGSEALNPYDESTTSLVNRYLAMPMSTAVQAEPYPLHGREPYINDHPARAYPGSETLYASYNMREAPVFNQRSYSLNAPCEPSKLNQGSNLHHETGFTSAAPVSSRYSFAGPSLSHRG